MAPHPRAGSQPRAVPRRTGGGGGGGWTVRQLIMTMLSAAFVIAMLFAYWNQYRCHTRVTEIIAKKHQDEEHMAGELAKLRKEKGLMEQDLVNEREVNLVLTKQIQELGAQPKASRIQRDPSTVTPTPPPASAGGTNGDVRVGLRGGTRRAKDPVQPPPPPPPGNDKVIVQGRVQGGDDAASKGMYGLPPTSFDTTKVAVLIFCYNRPDYLQKTIQRVLQFHPGGKHFPLFASQDGNNQRVQDVLRNFQDRVTRFEHPRQPLAPYVALAAHYKWALSKLFNENPQYSHVIIMEDDMEISEDFFGYFAATGHLLEHDKTLWCVSSWNDNGQGKYVYDSTLLYRSDFFPGLGWMMSQQLYRELEPGWAPTGYWDDWMRLPKVRKDRVCIRPEVSRTYNFGRAGGASGGQFATHLEKIQLNHDSIDWKSKDISYLVKAKYDAQLKDILAKAKVISGVQQLGDVGPNEEAKIMYNNYNHFRALAVQLGIMSDEKQMIPRTAYLGVVSFRWEGKAKRVHLVPENINSKLP